MSNTIAAIATASGNGSISILRVSGPEAVSITDSLFFTSGSKHVLSNAASHTIHYGWIGESPDHLIDEVLVLVMLAPRSYTAEDVVEIHCHGGGLAAESILALLIEHGVSLAEPGEFTKRAFLNGRIDLTQAESVMDVIRAKSDLALQTAENHLRGDVRDRVHAMREIILQDMAYLEAALDDPEHIELDDYPSLLRTHLEEVRHEISDLLKNAENGRFISEGIRTVIVGRPNVGKSSFLNCVLREDRAIVTDVPGTTRDTLEEDVRIGGMLLRLIDTAGIRDTSDPVERIGVDRARDAMQKADFVIYMVDSAEALTNEDTELLTSDPDIPGVIILNKSDLRSVVDRELLKGLFDGRDLLPIIDFSAKTGDGLRELESLLQDLFLNEFYSDQQISEPLITRLRQKEALTETVGAIDTLFETLNSGMPEDLLTVDLLAAYESLGRVTGDTIEDDLVDRIFSDFCMGK